MPTPRVLSMSTLSVHRIQDPDSISVVDDSLTQIAREDPDDDQVSTRANSIITSSNVAEKNDGPPPPPPPFRARLWSRDPITSIKRKIYAKVVGLGTFLVILVIFGVLSIFWASLFKVDEYVHKLEGWVIDFDGGQIGQTVIQAFQNNTGQKQQMTWRVVNASDFPNFPDDIEDAIVEEKTWAAVTINPLASNNLFDAISTGNNSYNGSLALTAWVNQARNENGYSMFIRPMVSSILAEASQAFAMQNSLELAANGQVDFETLLSQAPNLITTPIYFTIANLRPYDVPVATAVGYVGLIYLLIISFVVSMMNYNGRVMASGLNRHLRLSSLLLMRVIVPIILYFFVSIFFSLLSLAFEAPFNRFFGHSGFVIYWMMNWAGMCALGLAMESMITLLTPAFISFFLVLWIISNTSVSSVPIEVLPGVFKYGYASPFYNVSRTVKTLLFNTRNQIALNFGVQFAWIGVSVVTMTAFTIFMRRREEGEWERQQAEMQNDLNKEKA